MDITSVDLANSLQTLSDTGLFDGRDGQTFANFEDFATKTGLPNLSSSPFPEDHERITSAVTGMAADGNIAASRIHIDPQDSTATVVLAQPDPGGDPMKGQAIYVSYNQYETDTMPGSSIFVTTEDITINEDGSVSSELSPVGRPMDSWHLEREAFGSLKEQKLLAPDPHAETAEPGPDYNEQPEQRTASVYSPPAPGM